MASIASVIITLLFATPWEVLPLGTGKTCEDTEDNKGYG